jgi:hypothetical protein
MSLLGATMKRLLVVTAATGLVGGAAAHLRAGEQSGARAGSAYDAARTSWGDPDLQGIFTTDDELGVPFERPAQQGTRDLLTDAEFAERLAQAERQAASDAEEFVRERPAGRGGGGVGPPGHCDVQHPQRRTSGGEIADASAFITTALATKTRRRGDTEAHWGGSSTASAVKLTVEISASSRLRVSASPCFRDQ